MKLTHNLFSTKNFKKFCQRDFKNINHIKNYQVVLVYFALLFLVDMSGVMNLYEENYVRRIINMYRRRDPLSYQKMLNPFAKPIKQMLNEEEVKNLQSIEIPDTTDMPWFSRKNTSSHQCCEGYTENEKKIVMDISHKVKDIYEKEIGKKLYFLREHIPTIYTYRGHKSQHLWHVDPKNIDSIFNIIICIDRKGDISPLQYKDKDGKEHSIHFQPGDAAIFKGGTTIHQVPPNNDPNSERKVLNIVYTSDKKLSQELGISNNMCSYIAGGSNIKNIIILFLGIFISNLIISYLAKTKNLTYSFTLVFLAISLLLVKYIPQIHNLPIGSGRASSLKHNLVMVLIFILFTFSFKGGILFFLYFAITNIVFPRSWVFYY